MIQKKVMHFWKIIVLVVLSFSILAVSVSAASSYTCIYNTQGAEVYKPNYSPFYANNNECKDSTSLKVYSCTSSSTTGWFSALFMTTSSIVDCPNGCSNGVCVSCTDNDNDGYGVGCAKGLDCNDNNPAINPEGAEVCDNVDNDCDIAIDEGVSNSCTDYSSCAQYQSCNACGSAPVELCDNVDNNCNGVIDENCPYCGDGACNAGETSESCPSDCRSQLPPTESIGFGDYNLSLSYKEGYKTITRDYKVHVPHNYVPGNPTPVIFAYHGGGGDAETIMRQSLLSQKSESAGFIVVFPEGTGIAGLQTWNAGKCCGVAQDKEIDDVRFFDEMLIDLAKNFSIDSKRIYATGHSNGAMMAYRLACDRSEKVAAVAPNAGHDSYENCNPTRPVSIMHFSGLADDRIPYAGGSCAELDPYSCISAPDYSAQWAVLDGCSTFVQTYQNGTTSCFTHQSCNNGAEVTLCAVGNNGHTWPGGGYNVDSRWWRNQVGPISSDITATDAMWKFFQAHPIP